MRSFWFAVLWIAASAAAIGQADDAKKVYSGAQDSVFLVYLNDSTGTPTALGSAFLVKPLPLFPGEVSPGEQVFAIGNPEGLEKTISQGIVSGLRKRGERNLLQITSPISHGSSGGPILDAKGNVVGVAVGMFSDGQNLNFAVPVAYVSQLLSSPITQDSKPEPSSIDVSAKITEAEILFTKRQGEQYSGEADALPAGHKAIIGVDAGSR